MQQMKKWYCNLITGAFLASTLAASQAQTTFNRTVLDNTGSGTCAWSDVNNDGFLDLISVNNGTNLLYLNNLKGGFTSVPQGFANVAHQVGNAPGDYDNDGFLDLLVAVGAFSPSASSNLLYHNNGV